MFISSHLNFWTVFSGDSEKAYFKHIFQLVEPVNQASIKLLEENTAFTRNVDNYKDLYYGLSQVLLRLSFFKGNCFQIYPAELTQPMEEINDWKMNKLAKQLTESTFEHLGISETKETKLMLNAIYLTILYELLLKEKVTLKVGLEIQEGYFPKKIIMHFLKDLQFENSWLIMEDVQENEDYDLIITNILTGSKVKKEVPFYELSGLRVAYDYSNLNKLLNKLYMEKRELK